MKISIQTDMFNMLEEITRSNCDSVRFGPEFCEWKIPTLELLKEAYSLVKKGQKEFAYVIPRVSDESIEKIRRQMVFLNKHAKTEGRGKINVVFNDFGILNMLKKYPYLKPHLGRQLVYMPTRCPWLQNTMKSTMGFFERRHLEKIYYQTSLNYAPTIHFYKKYGINDIDVDWIPKCFPYFEFLMKNGLKISVYVHLLPVAVTRACHTARFLGERELKNCSKPCNKKAFLLRQKTLGVDLYLHGNVVFSFIKPSRKDIKKLYNQRIGELVITTNPISKMDNRENINKFIYNLKF